MDITEHLKKIQFQKSHPIVFISGMGGSGKTTFANKIVNQNNNAKHFELDWYLIHSSKERGKRIKDAFESGNEETINKEANPINHYDYNSFKKDIKDFQESGKFSVKNVWNQKTGEKDANYSLDFNGQDGLIVCDGDYLLHSEIASLADLVILLEVPFETARKRAEQRDMHRSDTEHLARKKLIAQKYDTPYFAENRKNATLVIASELPV
ncbi:hypothetical protein KKG24_03925 [Patescibacteria group bacterium]|nr:hypothetical protein [Patescibacteria group bacterium]